MSEGAVGSTSWLTAANMVMYCILPYSKQWE